MRWFPGCCRVSNVEPRRHSSWSDLRHSFLHMSPEQAKGFEVDARSDTFSFGSVLYEMLSGRQAFQGDTIAEILASVLVRDADFSLLPSNLNPRIQELLQRCLQKNPRRRWQAVGDSASGIGNHCEGAACRDGAHCRHGPATASVEARNSDTAHGDSIQHSCGNCSLEFKARASGFDRPVLDRASRRPELHTNTQPGCGDITRRFNAGIHREQAALFATAGGTGGAADSRHAGGRQQPILFTGRSLDWLLLIPGSRH